MLSLKFSYVNTFYHKFPILDIKKPPSELKEYADFLTCSDVLEHVIPPLALNIRGLYEILKPGGELIVSVPIVREAGETIEHYPGIQDYKVEKVENGYRVWGIFDSGNRLINNPIFHGGPGNTLELRRFSKQGFRSSLTKEGFIIVEEIDGDLEFGIPAGTGPIFRVKKPLGYGK
jgi:hypothetical protein